VLLTVFQMDETQCVPDTYGLCVPCVTDGDCTIPGGVCVTLAGEGVCTKPCAGSEECPQGYTCQDTGGDTLCLPDSGSCSCGPETLGLSAGCQLTWPPDTPPGEADAVCEGARTCGEDGWGDCEIGAEQCDGQDDDCDGAVDEDFTLDGAYVLDAHCGQCGNDCGTVQPPNAVGFCDAAGDEPVCAVQCAEGYTDLNDNLLDGCECLTGDGEDLPDGEDQNCDGIDGEVDNGVFVAPWGADDAAGTISDPLASIPAGIAKALETGKRDVYVAAGIYPGSVELVAGAHVYGGYSNNFADRDPAAYESRIVGGPPTPDLPAAVNAFGVDGDPDTVILDGLTVRGWDTDSPGASTYAVHLADCSAAVRLSNNHIIGGFAGAGYAGASGAPGKDGADGAGGVVPFDTETKSCSPDQEAAGGVGGAETCGDQDVSGGAGGAGLCPVFEADPDPAEVGAAGSGPAGGAGGAAAWDTKVHHASCKMCILPSDDVPVEGGDGAAGGAGFPGTSGAGCAEVGVVDGFWVAGAGGAGDAGVPGSGGGGGGAGGGVDSDKQKCSDIVSATGGGGGSGGCGGLGGLGGLGGGGSFALFVIFSEAPPSVPVLAGNVFEGGQGGHGAGGGNGGVGGLGGAGGLGGTFSGLDLWCVYSAGHGGGGGQGGHGGGGGGGCGGPSYGIHVHGLDGWDLSAWTENLFVLGNGGAGGVGGLSLGAPGQPGTPGLTANHNF